MKTRLEHLQWCKERAHQEYDFYKTKEPAAAQRNALASMVSDLRKHPETANMVEIAVMLGLGTARDEPSLMRFIDGFN